MASKVKEQLVGGPADGMTLEVREGVKILVMPQLRQALVFGVSMALSPLFSDVVYERSPDGVLRYTETVTPKCDGCGAVARYTLRDDPMTYWCVDCAKEA